MKRIAVLALIVGTLFIATPGQANAAACEFSLPQMPEECLTQPVYDYVTGLQADDLAQRTNVGLLSTENSGLRTALWQQSLDTTAARQATSLALADRDEALAQVDRLTASVTALQTRVHVLKKRIKRLEAQLPHFVS